jgi:hypothetical protein
MQKYLTTESLSTRLLLLEVMEKISQRLLIQFHVDTHLKNSNLVNIVMSYYERQVAGHLTLV